MNRNGLETSVNSNPIEQCGFQPRKRGVEFSQVIGDRIPHQRWDGRQRRQVYFPARIAQSLADRDEGSLAGVTRARVGFVGRDIQTGGPFGHKRDVTSRGRDDGQGRPFRHHPLKHRNKISGDARLESLGVVETLLGCQIDLASEQSFKKGLGPRHAEQRHGPLRRTAENEINVAFRSAFVASDRAEQGDMRHPRRAELVGVCKQQGYDIGSTHGYLIAQT